MLSDYKVIRKENLCAKKWSGGTTTQLYIYPENARFEDRDFIWRLSSATVDEETSDFTKLPDYNRILMILDGKLELNHNNTDIVNLLAFDQNEFDGANDTVSTGKVIDFNLIMRKDKSCGRLKPIVVPADEKIELSELNGFYSYENFTLAVYCYKSDIKIDIKDIVNVELKQGDVLVINFKEHVSNFDIALENLQNEEGNVVFAYIFY